MQHKFSQKSALRHLFGWSLTIRLCLHGLLLFRLELPQPLIRGDRQRFRVINDARWYGSESGKLDLGNGFAPVRHLRKAYGTGTPEEMSANTPDI